MQRKAAKSASVALTPKAVRAIVVAAAVAVHIKVAKRKNDC